MSAANFQYDHKHYKQIHETAMGSPISAVMANMVMEDLEERALTTLTNQPLFWKRFVDDVSTTTKLDSTLTFLEHLNSIEPCIKLTIEHVSEGKIAFLDTMVHRQEDGRLTTTVYQKPTHTDRYLSFSSYHPSMHKRAVIKCNPPWENGEKGERVGKRAMTCLSDTRVCNKQNNECHGRYCFAR